MALVNVTHFLENKELLHDGASTITLWRTVRTATGCTAGHMSVGHPSILHLFAVPSFINAA